MGHDKDDLKKNNQQNPNKGEDVQGPDRDYSSHEALEEGGLGKERGAGEDPKGNVKGNQ